MSRSLLPDRFEFRSEVLRTPAVVLVQAFDQRLERDVLLKSPGEGLEATFKDRSWAEVMMREARALARLNHPGVGRVLDVVETSTGPVQVLEPVTGEPLSARIDREGPMEPMEVARLGLRLAEILEAVHSKGVLHRGLSTHCILLGADDRPVLTGFHFAKSLDGGASRDAEDSFSPHLGRKATNGETGGVLPLLPAPEQLDGQAADERSDLYSLGRVLFRCLTGEESIESGGRHREVTAIVPGTPRELSRVLSRCLQTSPLHRYQSARDLADALLPLAGDPPAKEHISTFTTQRAAITAAAVLAAGVGLWGGLGAESKAGEDALGRGIGGVRTSPSATQGLTEDYENSFALLIGIGEAYRDTGFPPLRNAERDVDAIASALNRNGADEWDIEVLVGEAATRDEVTEALAKLSLRTGVNDRVLVYYAGHGLAHETSQNTGWMIPADAKEGRVSSYVRFGEFANVFDEARAKHIMLAMDCCYGGRMTMTRAASAGEFKRRFLTERAHVILTSGRGDEEVSDGDAGANSPFAEAFVAALQGGETITSSGLFYLMQRTFIEREVPHTPWIAHPKGSDARGQFVFF